MSAAGPASTTSPRSITDEIVGQIAGEFEILLDQQDRPCAPRCASVRMTRLDILDDRGLDALGRLVEDEQARLRDQRAGDGELLLLAAGEIAAAPPQHALQHRKERRRSRRECVRSPRGSGAKPVSRFSFTVSRGKISRPCGT